MENIVLLLLCVLTSKTDSQISLTPGKTCKIRDSISPFITGGNDTTAENAPWHAVLELKSKSKLDRIVNHCGGNILSPTIILTAAHCLWQNERDCPKHVWNQKSVRECHELPGGCPAQCTRVRTKDLNVYVGVTSIRQTDRIPCKVKSIILHPGWNKSSSEIGNHDLAIIVLKNELKFNSKVRHICLPGNQLSLFSGRYVSLNGFGYTEPKFFKGRLAERLQHGRLQIKNKDKCIDDYGKDRIKGDQLCAYSADTGSCNGDSGGGLVAFTRSVPVLVGTVSFGHIICRNHPGVYANVKSHVDWIQQKVLDISDVNGNWPRSWKQEDFCSRYFRDFANALDNLRICNGQKDITEWVEKNAAGCNKAHTFVINFNHNKCGDKWCVRFRGEKRDRQEEFRDTCDSEVHGGSDRSYCRSIQNHLAAHKYLKCDKVEDFVPKGKWSSRPQVNLMPLDCEFCIT